MRHSLICHIWKPCYFKGIPLIIYLIHCHVPFLTERNERITLVHVWYAVQAFFATHYTFWPSNIELETDVQLHWCYVLRGARPATIGDMFLQNDRCDKCTWLVPRKFRSLLIIICEIVVVIIKDSVGTCAAASSLYVLTFQWLYKSHTISLHAVYYKFIFIYALLCVYYCRYWWLQKLRYLGHHHGQRFAGC